MNWRLYRLVMRLAHHFNWHHTRTIHPEGDTLLVCDWCGLRYLKARREPLFHDGTIPGLNKLEIPKQPIAFRQTVTERRWEADAATFTKEHS